MASTRLSKGLLTNRVQRPVPLREGVYEALLELITRRQLPPGQHLVENELADRLGVSRQPVREALQRLSNEGWVDLRPGYGAFVHQPTESEAEQLLAVRALLETESARLAARNAAGEGVERLRELWREGVAGLEVGDTDAMVDANADLHRCITELSGNSVLAELAGQVARRVRWYHALVVRQRGKDAWDEHAEIIDAIAAGREDEAARLMREHTDTTRRTYHEQAASESAPAE
ncbi:DNA-binding GntR family transcriptional regulator [Spinactinospora alkalitolerans]|uniref:DNA-binding GntR family transcriptional regulator n=1 Tax=Spinactinospora alkalitolerans TaxID=687207 RepID=A0A852TUL3_9ACTN|nr:GntR family transcriptional regulator [Spinactinospora alkalitolerans]NYE46473.1 DNA-binding GntR family transcriptional regulator [Spinactinospora alkalitolerans]